MCDGDEDPTGIASTAEGPSTTDDGVDASSDGGTTVVDTTAMTSTAETTSGTADTGTNDTGTTAGVGEPPTAMINHPGVEDRQVGVPIPFIGVANDPEDGALSGASMQWTDDLEGVIGQGEQFDAALNMLGEHTVTLTAMDSDGNIGEATLTFNIVP